MNSNLHSDERRSWGRLLAILGIFLAIEVLSFGDLMEIIPIFAPLLNHFLFSFFHEIHNLLATAVVLFAAYKYGARLGITAVLVYLAIHVVYFTITSDEWPGDVMEITHVLLSGFVSFVGIWLISRTHASETRYRSLFTGMTDGLAYCRMLFEGEKPQDFIYLEVNEQFEKLTGLHAVTGKRVTEVIPGIRETNPELFDIYGRVASSGKPEMFETFVPGLDMWFSVSVYCPRKGHFTAAFDVITERKRTEERIRHLTNTLKAIRNVNQLITREKDREILIRKSCELLVQRHGYESAWILLLDENKKSGAVAGIGYDENTSAFLKQLKTGGYPECLRELLAQEKAFIAYAQPGKRQEWCVECVLASQHSNQDVFHGKLEHEGRLYGVMGVSVPPGTASDKEERNLFLELCDDIGFALYNIESGNKRKQLQEQLIAQDRLVSIGQLVSGVAHELNNPLTSVVGFSDLLLQRELPDDIKADLQIINDEAKRTSLIVRNLLTFARQQPGEKQAIDINQPITAVLQLRRHEQGINNIKVVEQFAPDLPQVIGNSSQLQQVFFNIITNAEQAMLEAHNKGTLTITAKQTGNSVQVSFTDDGPGIAREHMTRIFSPFFTTKEVGKGTGLGLSICQGIVTEHGGRIWAESEPGKGATFIVALPVYKKTMQ